IRYFVLTQSNQKSRQKYPRTGFLSGSRTPTHGASQRIVCCHAELVEASQVCTMNNTLPQHEMLCFT
ncbi:MAG: hypothetical protein LBK47_07430, partial [Prevotellaceae bacterium]|nr:hypothetical protein [Prevotellaceae bacterium]